jgi:hypothetical protein
MDSKELVTGKEALIERRSGALSAKPSGNNQLMR